MQGSRSNSQGEGEVTLPVLLAAAVAAQPDGDAVVDGDRRITYHDLDLRSNQLAHLLIELGVVPDAVLAIGMPRSLERVLAAWAITKAGAGCVSVDPTHPYERNRFVCADSGVRLGITLERYVDELPFEDMYWVALDDRAVSGRIRQYSEAGVADTDRHAPLRPHHTACLVYSGGSAGRPEGVAVTHAGLAAVDAQRRRNAVSPDAHVPGVETRTSVAAMLDLLLAAPAANLVMAPRDTSAAP
ncbi:AMP-binding protein [Nocardia tengchongensis]|uniref:AMP-binding protein n=1 Tax=Nocardia tengchongensis TaxID=2055889 RepID=UPI0036ABA2F2